MCGLVFAISKESVEDFIYKAHNRQYHRGPNGGGVFFDRNNQSYLGFAHERLAIVDLSNNGKQPMFSSSQKSIIIFNGEIYNYKELIKKYNLCNLKSNTDTEVVVELIELLGVEEASKQFNGMWSIVCYDKVHNKILISRDRLGKKPLYYTVTDSEILIASEMHSLLLHQNVSKNPDAVVVARFLSQSLMNIDDRSWVDNIKAFPPASTGEIDILNFDKGIVNIKKFWLIDFNEDFLDRRKSSLIINDIHDLVNDSVKIRLQADVPVGIALSGGIDSSIISALSNKYQTNLKPPVLFSAINPSSSDDESSFIYRMAKHLSLDVTTYELDPGKDDVLFDLLNKCISHNDGPIASFSNVLFYKLMEVAKNIGITVILTGQGADEAFCGYRKYPVLEIKRRLRNYDFVGALTLALSSFRTGTVLNGFKFSEAKRYIGYSNSGILGEVSSNAYSALQLSAINSLAERQWDDIEKYSVPYLCHYEDRMSMAWSREVRAPFLDYRLIELGLKTPTELKLHSGWTKYPLRKAFENYLPKSITWRKDKKGFVNPQDDWFKVNLRNHVERLMFEKSALVYEYGLVDRDSYLLLLKQYLSGSKHIWFREVFAPFVLEIWLQQLKSY